MGHAMHRVRREEKRRSRDEKGGDGETGEEDPGGGGEGGGGGSGGEDTKQGKEVEKHGEKDSGGQVRLRGALLQTYVLSILIRSIMEVLFVCLSVPYKQVAGFSYFYIMIKYFKVFFSTF